PNNCLLEVNGANVSMTRTGSYCEINRTSQSDNTYTYKVWVNDTAGNIASSTTRIVTIDTVVPTWSANTTNLTASTRVGESVYFNITLSDLRPAYYTFSWYNGTNWVNDTPASYTNNQEIQVIKTINIDIATINWTWYINDTAGNQNQTTTWSVLLATDDTTPPTITIQSPTNGGNYTSTSINLNVSANEAISAWWYSLNGGSNTTFVPNTTVTPSAGQNNITVYANDSYNNVGSSSITFNNYICGSTLTTNVTLTQNLNSTGTCYTIGAHNIVVDGNGYTITGNKAGYGLNNTGGYDNITIKNFAGLNNFTNAIYVSGSTGSIITNNTIIAANVSVGYGIYLLTGSNNNNVSSNTINTSGSSGYGIYIPDSNNSAIESNTIKTIGSSAYGILFWQFSSNNTILSNTITTSGGSAPGIFVRQQSKNNNLISNTITTSGSDSHGVWIRISSDNTNLTSNTITTTGATGIGVYFDGPNNGTLSSNTITTSGSTADGVSINNNNMLTSNTITVSGDSSDGIYIGGSTNTLSSNTVAASGSTAYGIYLASGDTNTLTNDNITSTNANDIRINSGEMTSTNLTFNKSDIGFDTNAAGNITVKWYLDLTAQNASGTNIQNANVSIYNAANSLLFNGLTGSDGKIPLQTLVEVFQSSSSTTYHTPHTINGTLLKYLDNSTTVNFTITNSTAITFVLPDDRAAPANITYVSPTQNNNTVTQANYYTVNVTFIEVQPEACLLEVGGANISMTRTGFVCFINRTGQSEGTYTYKVHVNDSAGNRGTSSTRTITLDTTVPSVTLPQINITGSIPITTQIRINVTATDSSAISAVLVGNSTNLIMSSIGLNRYQVSTTPSSLGCSSDQATCLLRFYVNDTAGNLNSTTTLTLNIFGCGQTLTSSSTLTNSLTSTGSCFTIGANNLVINGAGKSITGGGSGVALNVSGFTNVTVTNLTISNFGTDVLVTTGSATLLNTTFSRQKTTVSGSGNLTTKWYVNNVVREWGFDYFEGYSGGSGYCGDSKCGSGEDYYTCPQDCSINGSSSGGTTETCGNGFCGSNETSSNCAADCGGSAPIAPGISLANLTLYNSFGSVIYSGLTNSNGQIPKLELTEFIQTSAGRTLYTLHSINVSKEGYAKFSRLLNLTATGSTSLSHVLNNPFANCDSYAGNQTKCEAAKCEWKSDISKCAPASTYLDCDQFCGKCITQPTCTASTRSCQWTSSGSGGYCNENFNTFTYGTGGTTNSSGYFNFVPVDCFKEPNKCDSRYDVDKGYYKFETLCSDGVDNDEDGSADCSDTDCTIWPQCSSSYNASSDTTPPKITNSKTDLDNSSVSISTTTTEPTTYSVKYYGTNSTCTSSPAIIGERNLANCSLDDYSVWHHVNLDSSAGVNLAQNSTYYYKINGTDKAGISYETGCLNFTTKSSVQAFNFRAFVPGEFVKIKSSSSDSFTNYDFSSSASEFTNYKGAEMKFEGAGITFRNIDISSSKSLNFTNAFVSGNRSLFGSKFQGINSSNWLETSQSLGLAPSDNISLTIESAGNRIFKCDDNGGNCTQLTECYSVISSNATHTTIELAAAAGFSAYTVADNAQLLIWDQTDSNNSLYDASGATKTTADSVTFYANYSNLTSGGPINITGSYCEFNTTSVNPVNMTYSSSRGLYSYSAQISSAATHQWSVRCFGNSTFDNTNATNNITIGSPASASPSSSGGNYNPPTPKPNVTVKPTTQEPEEPINFTLDKDLIKVSLRQGQSQSVSFIINNRGKAVQADISVVGDSNLVFLDTSRISLNSGEGYEIKGKIVTTDSQVPGVYTSKIKVLAGGTEKVINLIVEVSSKKALFDVRLDISPDQRSIGIGSSEISPQITMINIGDLEKVDVVLRYAIKDSQNKVVSETIETKGIEKQLSFTRDIQLPTDLIPDSYVAYVEVTYNGAVAVASQLFRIESGAKTRTGGQNLYAPLLAVIIVIIVGFFMSVKIKSRRNGRPKKWG
ncbi:MAG: right-handed parallel beta-helix repeat-containing protein, partial [Candidatus Aenigmarchaeota archaeon]|nr:right-handed parallel beta-helix repeat-containing protein [Candidatus Aenigmarchaeota archaeon]